MSQHDPSTSPPHPHVWRVSRDRVLALDVPRVIGILNVTPDSFSDGGDLPTAETVKVVAEQMIRAGAAALDVGGESTRPGARPVSEAEQIRRTLPAIRAIRDVDRDIPISIDTTRAAVARAALDAGATIINDVSGGLDDPQLLPLAAASGCGLVLMHRLRSPASDVYAHQYPSAPLYDGGVICAVHDALVAAAQRAVDAGVHRTSIVLDPGLGFGKSVEQNLDLIRATPKLLALGYPILSALSRKSFVAAVGGVDLNRPPKERLRPTLALSIMHMQLGCRLFRVHDVEVHVTALRAAAAVGA